MHKIFDIKNKNGNVSGDISITGKVRISPRLPLKIGVLGIFCGFLGNEAV